jgi:hypothetical protein
MQMATDSESAIERIGIEINHCEESEQKNDSLSMISPNLIFNVNNSSTTLVTELSCAFDQFAFEKGLRLAVRLRRVLHQRLAMIFMGWTHPSAKIRLFDTNI